ncbi:hypothetical protein A3D66_02440 [Candidatus Kaiserbacteria bacterium RIFCSPHIGHO2_02_FULL_50_9]|nr:MAG: hypothetical protein A3D66_02440 [Candidatus Kaiserbacteria bacterium RIFCSPHIGHO2_02_FULL_50_9]
MCAIAAVVGNQEYSYDRVRSMLSLMLHRGNYPYEMAQFEGGALGTNRLAIVDEPGGTQPQTNENNSVHVVFNGEIFNYREQTLDLQQVGHTFRTASDTETLVHLWEQYGSDIVQKLDSEMFAFVIYDTHTKQVFAARDRLGIKPLYYAFNTQNSLYFASEIKALAQFEDIQEIHEFPPGHVYTDGVFKSFWSIPTSSSYLTDHSAAILQLRELIEEAVAKRLQTDLPIGVFLSGGVDSSLIMEIATRYHKNVTALILGSLVSSDFEFATKLCREKGWQFKICEPTIDYERELSDLIYSLEAWNPNAVEHAFANKLISKFAHDLGYKVVLTGEGSDELFAGFNEFLELPQEKINEGCRRMLQSMSKGSHMRVDKMAMKFTLETRSPLFDNKIIDLAFRVPGEWKIGNHDGQTRTKLILREAASTYLPDYIVWRPKVPFANGAGMDVAMNYTRSAGVFRDLANKKISDSMLADMQTEHPECGFEAKEEVLFFFIYKNHGYTKFAEGNEPLVMKDVLVRSLV